MMGHRAVVIVTDRDLFPVNAGNRARIVTLVQSLRALGFQVVVVARRTWDVRRAWLMHRLADLLITVPAERFRGGSPSAYDCRSFFAPLQSVVSRVNPVAVIAEYIWMAPCLEAARNGATRFLDTHDVMHMREQFGDRLSDAWVTCTREEERALLRLSDVVIAIQPRELDRFQELVPDRSVICLPHHVPVQPVGANTGRRIVAMIGSGNPGNVEGLRAFADEAWPVVRGRHPDAQLRIYGELAGRVPVQAGVVPVGYAKNLRRVYAGAAVVINPVRFGTGLKIKTVEALAHGKPLVTTSCGAAGLESQAALAFVVEDDMRRFGNAVAALLGDETARRRLQVASRAFAATEFSRERVFDAFLRTVAGGRPQHLRGTDRPAVDTLAGSDAAP